MQWQPIETAPKDGMRILVRTVGGRITIVRWHRRQWTIYADYDNRSLQWLRGPKDWLVLGKAACPTHWMPLPASPALP